MPGGNFVTTGHTSGSAGAGMTACAVAEGARRVPALMAVNAPPRNARRLIMSDLPQRQRPESFPPDLDLTCWPHAPQVGTAISLALFLLSCGRTREQFIATTGACNDHRPRPDLLGRGHPRCPGLYPLQCDGGHARARRVWTSGCMLDASTSLSGGKLHRAGTRRQ